MNNYSESQLVTSNDDTVYCLYFTTAGRHVQESYWENLNEVINKELKDLSCEYIWHKDKLEVFPPILNKKADDVPIHLFSSTCFGDNIEDEWFIVYLVFELTKKFSDLVVKISDSDGDFLLVEAADYLPKWMNPENMEHRVFIMNGEIHVIPASIVDFDTDLSLKDAIFLVKSHAQETKVSDDIQMAVLKRISGYPHTIKDNIHRALVEVPLDLATVLTLQPTLISPIVHAYCNHDVIDAKCCKNLKSQDIKTVKISFTKCQYAMLLHSKVMRTVSHIFAKKNDKRYTLGLKLLCGYKIIMNDSLDITSSKDYRKFLDNLKKNGYFKENLEGSKEYVSLLEKANEYYMLMLSPVNKNVHNTITKLKSTKEFIELKEKLMNTDETLQDEDNEDWLNIQPDQLNDLLVSRYGQQVKLKDEITPETITDQLSSFLHKASDFEGIELNEEDKHSDDKIEFDCEMFADALQDMLKIISSGNTKDRDEDDFSSDFDEENECDDKIQNDLDQEIRETLSSDIIKQNAAENIESTYSNILQSLKEEEGFFGPSSNLLNNIDIRKNDLLDSDDDSE